MQVNEIFERVQIVTIKSATTAKGIDRKKADRILDPHGYFEKNKRATRRKMREATEDIPEIVMQELYKTGLTPEECDDGYCDFVAEKIVQHLGRGRIMSSNNYPPGYFEPASSPHYWVYVDGKHYDVETPFGVTDPRQLGYWHRLRGLPMPPTNYEPDVEA